MTKTPAAAALVRRLTLDAQSKARAYVCGFILALGASLSFAFAHAAILDGLMPA